MLKIIKKVYRKLFVDRIKIDQFEDILIEHCQYIAEVRFEKAKIQFDNYLHLRNFIQFLVFDCYSIVINSLEDGKIKKSQLNDLFFEYLYFFISLIDRFALSIIGEPGRQLIMKELGEFAIMLSVQVLFLHKSDKQQQMIFHDRIDYLNIAMSEYRHFTNIFPHDNEGTKDTLFWEFSIKVVNMFKVKNNIGDIIGQQHIIGTVLKNMDINSFLNKMKE